MRAVGGDNKDARESKQTHDVHSDGQPPNRQAGNTECRQVKGGREHSIVVQVDRHSVVQASKTEIWSNKLMHTHTAGCVPTPPCAIHLRPKQPTTS
jgi:hypothetical protein